jgi:hypothetical protein
MTRIFSDTQPSPGTLYTLLFRYKSTESTAAWGAEQVQAIHHCALQCRTLPGMELKWLWLAVSDSEGFTDPPLHQFPVVATSKNVEMFNEY